MKKLILALVLFSACLVSQAQLATLVLPDGKSYISTVTDYNVTNTTVGYTLFNAPQHFKTTQDISVELDSVSGNHTNVAVALFGQKFTGGAWVAIGSAVNWKGTTKDTTIVISNTTANRFRNFKLQFTGTGTGVTKVDKQEFKLWYE